MLPTPFNPSPQARAQLLEDLADPALSFRDLAHRHETTIEALSLYLESPDIQQALALRADVISQRLRLIAADHLSPAIAAADAVLAAFIREDEPPAPTATNTQPPAPTTDWRATRNALYAAGLLYRITRHRPIPYQTTAYDPAPRQTERRAPSPAPPLIPTPTPSRESYARSAPNPRQVPAPHAAAPTSPAHTDKPGRNEPTPNQPITPAPQPAAQRAPQLAPQAAPHLTPTIAPAQSRKPIEATRLAPTRGPILPTSKNSPRSPALLTTLAGAPSGP